MFKKAILVDYENVTNEGLAFVDRLSEETKVVIFFSKNANSMTFQTHQKLMESKAVIEYMDVTVGGRNALDIQLATYLGYLAGKNEAEEYCIISKDNGFRYVETFCEQRLHIAISCKPYIGKHFVEENVEEKEEINAEEVNSETVEIIEENQAEITDSESSAAEEDTFYQDNLNGTLEENAEKDRSREEILEALIWENEKLVFLEDREEAENQAGETVNVEKESEGNAEEAKTEAGTAKTVPETKIEQKVQTVQFRSVPKTAAEVFIFNGTEFVKEEVKADQDEQTGKQQPLSETEVNEEQQPLSEAAVNEEQQLLFEAAVSKEQQSASEAAVNEEQQSLSEVAVSEEQQLVFVEPVTAEKAEDIVKGESEKLETPAKPKRRKKKVTDTEKQKKSETEKAEKIKKAENVEKTAEDTKKQSKEETEENKKEVKKGTPKEKANENETQTVMDDRALESAIQEAYEAYRDKKLKTEVMMNFIKTGQKKALYNMLRGKLGQTEGQKVYNTLKQYMGETA